ncbi:hypothetical protein LCGC14_1214150 [marine sediment metagenome]|uniref:Uncharacterized protein n=1 Tax=marine sediment metagenome TaxID=412755 RepID=A0A0F9LHC7_9ZZZZ|nr:hypothetical protein [Methylophaga sp.]
MTKEKITINVDEALKTSKRLEKEIVEKQETVKALKIVTDARRITEALDSENGKIKREMERNSKILVSQAQEMADNKLTILNQNEQVEAKKAESKDRIKDIENNEKKRIKDVRDNSNEIMEEANKEAFEAIKASKKAVKEANKKSEDAITKKDKAEADLNKLTKRILEGVK